MIFTSTVPVKMALYFTLVKKKKSQYLCAEYITKEGIFMCICVLLHVKEHMPQVPADSLLVLSHPVNLFHLGEKHVTTHSFPHTGFVSLQTDSRILDNCH